MINEFFKGNKNITEYITLKKSLKSLYSYASTYISKIINLNIITAENLGRFNGHTLKKNDFFVSCSLSI